MSTGKGVERRLSVLQGCLKGQFVWTKTKSVLFSGELSSLLSVLNPAVISLGTMFCRANQFDEAQSASLAHGEILLNSPSRICPFFELVLQGSSVSCVGHAPSASLSSRGYEPGRAQSRGFPSQQQSLFSTAHHGGLCFKSEFSL